MIDMHPCPHCGSTQVDIYELADSCGRNIEYKVECFNDDCEPYQKTKEDAIKFWNTRKHYYPEPFDVEKYYD
jgi:hypothetical protein